MLEMNLIAPYTIAFLCFVLTPRALVTYFWTTGYNGYCSTHTNITILVGVLSTNILYLILLRMLLAKDTRNFIRPELYKVVRNSIMLLTGIPLLFDTASCVGYKVDCNYATDYAWLVLAYCGVVSHIINSLIAIVWISYPHKPVQPIIEEPTKELEDTIINISDKEGLVAYYTKEQERSNEVTTSVNNNSICM